MIAKTSQTERREPSRRRRRQQASAPLDVGLTLKFTFGDEPDDTVTVMDDRRIPMVDSVFKNRDRIIKSFIGLLIKTGLSQPKVAREIFPAVRFLKRKRKA